MISYGDKMPCSITDGKQYDDLSEDYPEIDMSDGWAQFLLDEKRRRAEEIIAESINDAMRDIFGTGQAD